MMFLIAHASTARPNGRALRYSQVYMHREGSDRRGPQEEVEEMNIPEMSGLQVL